MKLEKEFYNRSEFAQIINKDPRTIKTLEKNNIITKGKKLGNKLLYKREDVLKAIDHYGIETNKQLTFDVIISNNYKKIKQITDEYYIVFPKLFNNISELKNEVNNINRVFVDKEIVNKEEWCFLLEWLKMYEIELIEV